MASVSVYNKEGKEVEKIDLNDSVFAAPVNEHLVHMAVVLQLANKRQGTHKSKERSEISGSTRKLKKQKGTGGARSGDINSPVMVGGARVFGPKPRDYSFKLNKKVKALARKSALSLKAQDNAIVVVEDFSFEAPKTKEFVSVAKNLQLADKKLLLVLADQNKNVYLSARNVVKAKVVTVSELNTYKVLDCASLVLTESSVAAINNF